VIRFPLYAALLALALTGCATDPAPVEQLRLTEQTLVQTRALHGSAEQSAVLQQAQDKYQAAQEAMAKGHYRQARMLAEQAELDARLAEAERMQAFTDAQVMALQGSIEQLRKQLGALQ
jgi:hypothetical protein